MDATNTPQASQEGEQLTSSICGWCGQNESDGATTNSGTKLCDDCDYEISKDNEDCAF